MNLTGLLSHLTLTKKFLLPGIQYAIQTCQYAAPGGVLGKMKRVKKGMPTASKKIVLPVETDVKRLVSFVCGTNILKEGGQDVEIKPDSEYPDWLWTIRTGNPPRLNELDPNTKAYWRKLRKIKWRQNNHRSESRRY